MSWTTWGLSEQPGQGIPGAAIDAFFQRIATRVVQDLEDAPVVAPPSEEEVALAWRPKD